MLAGTPLSLLITKLVFEKLLQYIKEKTHLYGKIIIKLACYQVIFG